MNVHEYQAKELLRGYGVPLATGAPAFTLEEARQRRRSCRARCGW